MRATFCALAIATLVLALSACGDDSSGEKASTPTPQEQAQTTVCDARADISAQVDELKGLTAATVTKDGVKQSLETIKKSLSDISGAQSEPRGDRPASDAKTALVTALQQLATSYQTAFEPLNCK